MSMGGGGGGGGGGVVERWHGMSAEGRCTHVVCEASTRIPFYTSPL